MNLLKLPPCHCVVSDIAIFVLKRDVKLQLTNPVSLWNYDLCDQYPTTVPDAVTVYLQCDQSAPPRRYLVVQRPTTTYLEFCEIEVYLRRKSKLLAYTLASCYSPKCTVA